VDLEGIDQQWTIYLAFGKYLKKNWKYKNKVYQLVIDFEKAYDSIKRESLYDILIKFGIPKKLVRLIKTCLDGTQKK
jgi:Reverse transcriptase (RNA-dependent DNA polymerase).